LKRIQDNNTIVFENRLMNIVGKLVRSPFGGLAIDVVNIQDNSDQYGIADIHHCLSIIFTHCMLEKEELERKKMASNDQAIMEMGTHFAATFTHIQPHIAVTQVSIESSEFLIEIQSKITENLSENMSVEENEKQNEVNEEDKDKLIQKQEQTVDVEEDEELTN
jgi:hypothetical protein